MVMPLGLAAANIAIKTWIDSQIAPGGVLTSFAEAPYTVIWGYQSAPRPALPYAVLSWATGLGTIGGKPSRTIIDNGDDTFTERSSYDAEMLLRIELLSRAPLDPDSGLDETMPLLSGIEASLITSRQQELFTNAGLAFIETRSPLVIPVVAGFGYERRARMDVLFRARVRVDDVDVPVLVSGSLSDIASTVEDGVVTVTVGGV